MYSNFVVAAIISVVFFITKAVENKFAAEENKKPVKFIVRDTLLVYLCVLVGHLIIEQFNNMEQSGGNHTPVFTDNPEF